MAQGLRLNRFGLWPLVLAVAFAAALPAAAGAAAPVTKSHGPLSPLLARLAKPAVAAQPPAAQDELLGVTTEEPGGLIRDGERVQVTVRFDEGALGALPELREAGARVLGAGREQQTATLAVTPADLGAVAAVPGVRSAWPARRPVLYDAGEGPCEGGSAISEGLGQLRVGEAREAFDLRGKGITVGVLSDSYDAATEAVVTDARADVASNDLPGLASSCSEQQLPVDVLQDLAPAPGEEAGDEGRAMLQIVHDLAPHAHLAFATAFESEESFAANIERLARPVSEGGAGADVIVDDVAWFEEPFFQDGPVAAAIDQVTSEGVTYLTAAGNDNLFDGSGHEIASWEAPEFRDSGACPAAVAALAGFNGSHCMDFKPGPETDRTFGITVEPGETLTLDLQWAEPWNGVLTDLDAVLLSATGKEVLTGSAEQNTGVKGTQRPVEIVQWTNEAKAAQTVQLAINRFSGLDPRLKFILMENGGGVSATEYPVSGGGDVVGPTIFGHAGAASAISVAAVPFNNSAKAERYSSRGPVAHYFGPVQGTVPALPLGLPEEVAKPDLAATDCGATTFFAFLSGGIWRFCGTSAAAPHAAAVAALVRQAKPTLPEQQVRDALTGSADPVGVFGPNAVGAGLVDAFEAIGGLPGPIEGGDGPSEIVPPLEKVATGNPTQPDAPSGEQPAPSPAPAPAPAPTPQPAAKAPGTTILRHPPKLVRTLLDRARVVLRFGSDQRGSTFLCKVDRSAFRACPARFVLRLAAGAHVLKVKARSVAGLTDPTPAAFRFRIVRS
ncbi:MAG TPA: S8 family serine peptidase [Solirubrobacterales bacterium]|nr:S8 family serine peptidase [Solirubrobacterales bacterium]